MSFQIHALDKASFNPLIALSDDELHAVNARRVTVDQEPGFPCRVSLHDAKVGESVILTHFVHQPNQTPYHASHAIYIREMADEAKLAQGTIPESIARRLISVRAYDEEHAMVDADVVEGTQLEGVIAAMFADANIAYLHLHHAKRGCFAASVTRADGMNRY